MIYMLNASHKLLLKVLNYIEVLFSHFNSLNQYIDMYFKLLIIYDLK